MGSSSKEAKGIIMEGNGGQEYDAGADHVEKGNDVEDSDDVEDDVSTSSQAVVLHLGQSD